MSEEMTSRNQKCTFCTLKSTDAIRRPSGENERVRARVDEDRDDTGRHASERVRSRVVVVVVVVVVVAPKQMRSSMCRNECGDDLRIARLALPARELVLRGNRARGDERGAVGRVESAPV